MFPYNVFYFCKVSSIALFSLMILIIQASLSLVSLMVSQRTNLIFLDFLCFFFFFLLSILFISNLTFISFFLHGLDLVCSSFSRF